MSSDPDTIPIHAPKKHPEVPLEEPRLYINRELSWIQFNRRVLEEAQEERHPLLERVKFLAIFASNLDEFMMIRVSGLRRQRARGVLEAPPDGMTPSEQLAAIRQELMPLVEDASSCWQDDILPKLNEAGIHIRRHADLAEGEKRRLRDFFERRVFPVLTPMAFDVSHPFPFISNLSLNLAVVINDPQRGVVFSRVKVPIDVLPRLVRIPEETTEGGTKPEQALEYNFVFLEDLVASNLDLLFPGMEVAATYPFRVTRDADLEIEEDEASDLLTAIEEGVELRRIGTPIRLELSHTVPAWVREILTTKFQLPASQVYTPIGPVGIADLMELTAIDRPDLKDQPFLPAVPPSITDAGSIFDAIRQHDILLYHPYDSFAPVITFLQQAAADPDVLAIKMTLYRAGLNSPVVEALMDARMAGKQVAVLVELKARFDEENNILWARALERAGVHVVYGLVGLKVHAKMCMVVRREKDGLVTYTHMGTGNYNAGTARIYTDLGLFSADPKIGADVADLFNALTGYSRKIDYRQLLVSHGSMGTMRQEVINLIEGEIRRQEEHGDGYIALKMNALVDKRCIQALYRASRQGVTVDLQVRGICCLRPGIPEVSENITVTSIVGRFLEHSRIYYFHNGGDPIVFSGSADLMPRNLNRRVEILFPIRDARIKETVIRDILMVHLRDTEKSRRLLNDGTYERVVPKAGEEPLHSQQWMLAHRGIWHTDGE
ncbi:polyphosphate kinase 1 [Methanoculleus sp. FWC-SCC1]|uniref:Polyphosphate kinase n=1 Tax=Methanoculleus frigidifontis TaxID=2584085 RepID=A0ABT8MAB8_9EURY|nr:polyphosphate kinase 1 [Methanoculleus sp. FWC-SCC1]MDN7024881.1 polyphosphate kinase 1 [Methanoculleus sp. FWC-SCC1]